MTEKHVITLLANDKPLDAAVISMAVKALEQSGAAIDGQAVLDGGSAQDVFFSGVYPEDAEKAVRVALADLPVDIVAQPVDGRRKKLLITDMDSTVITIECIDEIADFVGKKAEVSAITERAMNGELDFKAALRERVQLLAGLPEVTLQTVYDERVEFMPGAKELVRTMRDNGAYCVLVSGGFTFFTSRVRDALGFHEDFSNQLEVRNGVLTGKVVEPILDKDSKLQTLLDKTIACGISLQDTLAVGDGANDLPMLMAAGLGVAYHAKPSVRVAANARINFVDLSSLLAVQGL